MLNKNLNILILFSLAPLLMTTSYSNQIYYNVASVINTVGILFTLCASYNFYTRINTNETSHTGKIYEEMNNMRESISRLVYEIHLGDIKVKILLSNEPKIINAIFDKGEIKENATEIFELVYRCLLIDEVDEMNEELKINSEIQKKLKEFIKSYVDFYYADKDFFNLWETLEKNFRALTNNSDFPTIDHKITESKLKFCIDDLNLRHLFEDREVLLARWGIEAEPSISLSGLPVSLGHNSP